MVCIFAEGYECIWKLRCSLVFRALTGKVAAIYLHMSDKIADAKNLVKFNISIARFLRFVADRLERDAIRLQRDINRSKINNTSHAYRTRGWLELTGHRLTHIVGKAFFYSAGASLEIAKDIRTYSDSNIFRQTDYFEKDGLSKLKLKYKLTEFEYYTPKHYRSLLACWNGFGYVIHDEVDSSGAIDCFDNPARVITIRPMGDYAKGVEFKFPAYALMRLRKKQDVSSHEVALSLKRRKK